MATTNSAVEEIKSRCNIVDVIGRAIPLKRAGSNYKGVCPFHNEKTPSFVVSETKQIYTCFGCGATGDVIEFVERYYQLDFIQAIEKLADEYGIKLEAGFKKDQNKEIFYQINREAAKFFYKAFRKEGNPGHAYMTNRGIAPEILTQFGVGYADDSFHSLMDHLISLGFQKEILFELGLISHSKGKYYDKFRDRVMFPILNTRGKVIGFGGRVIGQGEPKYLNSPESSVFLKKNNLYGLNLTRQEIGKVDLAILVEGYMDVISLYQSGVRNVSASLGTALTENQAKLLKRYTHNIVLSYDADEAGVNAALRGLDILYKEDCKVKVLHIDDGKDPDEFVKKNGKKAYLNLLEEALPYADYRFNLLKKQFDLEQVEDRVDFLKKAVEVIEFLNPVEAEVYIKKLAQDTNISEGAIRLEMGGNNRQKSTPARPPSAKAEAETAEASMLEKNMLKLLLTDSSYYQRILPYETQIFKSETGQELYSGIKELHVEQEEIDTRKLSDTVDESGRKLLDSVMKNVRLSGKEETVFQDCIKTIQSMELGKQEQALILRLSMADEQENQETIRELTEELMEIQKMLKNNRG